MQTSSSLTAHERDRALAALTAMLEGFPQKPADAVGMARAFVEAVDDLPIGLIEDTAIAFARGKIRNRNNAFPPSTAEFHAYIDSILELEEREEELRRMMARRPPPEEDTDERSEPADRARFRSSEEITAERHRKQLENHAWREWFIEEHPQAAARILRGIRFDPPPATGKRLAS